MTKIVIATVPFVDEDSPLAAPAVLKAALMSHGIDCVGLDLNIHIYNKIRNHPKREKFVEFFWKQKIDEEIVDEIKSMLYFYVEELLSHKPTIIGLSLFSRECQTFAAWLCAVLRHKAPSVRIVIGGPGLETLNGAVWKYPERLKHMRLIDDYITGDAEESLVNYVKNIDSPGINELAWIPPPDFDKLPLPDYSDYRFFHYGNILLPIVDSRGCVQNCEFCDVIAFWKKFRSLTAENIFSQMKFHIKKYGIYRFQFASSICNGNLKEFRKLIRLIADYNNSVISTDEQIHWIGSFIVRPASNHPEEMWKLIKESNGFLLTGVESIVEHVRIALGKKFNNADLDHHLEMGRKYQVPMNLLMIASYPTETPDDYEKSKQWFIDHREFANNTVMQVQITLPQILHGTKLQASIDRDQFNQRRNTREEHARELYNIIKSCGFVTKPFFSV